MSRDVLSSRECNIRREILPRTEENVLKRNVK